MCRLLETIQLFDGNLQNVEYHNRRLNASRREYFGVTDEADLKDMIEIPEEKSKGLFRCRFVYSANDFKVDIQPYAFRNVNSLKLVYDNEIDYHLKYADRTRLDALFNQRGDCDDIIIVKHNCLTDSYASNLVFFDGKEWLTPNTPLLPGTMRANLLEKKVIRETGISISDLNGYLSVGLINAFLSSNNMPVVPVANIKF